MEQINNFDAGLPTPNWTTPMGNPLLINEENQQAQDHAAMARLHKTGLIYMLTRISDKLSFGCDLQRDEKEIAAQAIAAFVASIAESSINRQGVNPHAPVIGKRTESACYAG